NKGRGAKFRLFIATQTFADFSARTGSEAKARQILGNVNNLIALRVMDAETQAYITDNLPKTRLKYIMRTQGVSTHSSNPAVFSGNIGERLMEEEGDLFAPQLLGQLPDLHYIAKLSGGRIVKGRLPVLRSRLDREPTPPPSTRKKT
ncbi:MAG: TraM recognition domain-containing protein, partial [Candidatus Methylumidiphilus sp.]